MNASKLNNKNLKNLVNFDLHKVVLLGLFKFSISFVYVLLTVLKEPLVMMSSGSGAEVLPVLKSNVVFPASVLFVVFFGWLSNKIAPRKIFFGLFIFFLLFFLTYNFILRPNEQFLTISEKRFLELVAMKPHLRHFIVVYRDWIHALCFMCIELYGQIIIFLVFWGLANDLCSKEEAKVFYPIFIIMGCIGGLVGTEINIYFLKGVKNMLAHDSLVSKLFSIGIIGITFVLGIYTVVYSIYYRDKKVDDQERKQHNKKITFLESMRYLASNRYLLGILILVIACGLTINLVDVTYKANLKALFETKWAYQLFSAKVNRWLQILSAFLALFVSRGVLRYFSWKVAARIAPVVVVGTGLLFFLTSKFRNYLGWVEGYGIAPLTFVVYMGVFQTMISKVAKYVFFDSTKEMAYLNLDPDTRIKGKSAVEMLGSRSGKSISGAIHLGLLYIFATSNVFNLTHILFVFLLLIGVGWFVTVGHMANYSERHKK